MCWPWRSCFGVQSAEAGHRAVGHFVMPIFQMDVQHLDIAFPGLGIPVRDRVGERRFARFGIGGDERHVAGNEAVDVVLQAQFRRQGAERNVEIGKGFPKVHRAQITLSQLIAVQHVDVGHRRRAAIQQFHRLRVALIGRALPVQNGFFRSLSAGQ